MNKYTTANSDHIAELGYGAEDLAELYIEKANKTGNKEYYEIADKLRLFSSRLDELSTESARIGLTNE